MLSAHGASNQHLSFGSITTTPGAGAPNSPRELPSPFSSLLAASLGADALPAPHDSFGNADDAGRFHPSKFMHVARPEYNAIPTISGHFQQFEQAAPELYTSPTFLSRELHPPTTELHINHSNFATQAFDVPPQFIAQVEIGHEQQSQTPPTWFRNSNPPHHATHSFKFPNRPQPRRVCVSQACDCCRTAKLKCSGLPPELSGPPADPTLVCDRCRKKSLPCTFGLERLKRGRPRKEKELEGFSTIVFREIEIMAPPVRYTGSLPQWRKRERGGKVLGKGKGSPVRENLVCEPVPGEDNTSRSNWANRPSAPAPAPIADAYKGYVTYDDSQTIPASQPARLDDVLASHPSPVSQHQVHRPRHC
ncbi:hypothetical protein M427DRAFT_150956 [Gonapodya prolifera JEL478]|uniref:Zn(2)-C6 fungal-type domain-containing protein n=1 Tax=Gonapodya prolifera (strain JEL478) TaxID=1344416 RepID=A0A139AYT4_GONPJ|nr:hypothetical protein M427DRAFT_150956 [Gonapodya prolifera JEL478]|eukprot:KXS21625.1 hypothetical protein M427DRAFT_150956 [Gonapodya prolifera JEL478]